MSADAVDLEGELARRDALAVARALADGSSDAADRVRTGSVVLGAWSGDAEVRAALRPLFEAAVPDQRALVALGDIDTWLRDGRVARRSWVRASAGPDPELAALGAWRAARADLRGGRPDDALPLLRQADAAGIAAASLALGRIREERGDDAAAAPSFRRSRSREGMLRLAEIRLRADDVDGAERELHHFTREAGTAGSPDLGAWEDVVRGEIAFRRGYLEAADALFSRARGAPGDRDRLAELRLAQIAVAEGDPAGAYFWTTGVADGSGPEAEQAQLLMELHPDLLAEGARLLEEEPEEDVEPGEPDEDD